VSIQIQDRNGMTETVSAPDRLEIYESVDFMHAQPYKKVLRVYRKEGKTASRITTYHPNGQLWQYLEAKELRASGQYKEWYPNGQLKILATVIGGTADVAQGSQHDWLFDGVNSAWDEQGHLIAEIPYRQGVLDGVSLYYYPNGQIEKSFPFIRNVLEGESLAYYSNGKVHSKSTYRSGLLHGATEYFFENGRVMASEQYDDGLLLTGDYRDPSGNRVTQITDGFGFRAMFENDRLTMLAEYQRGQAEGVIKEYSPKGSLTRAYHIKNGKKHGEEIEYFEHITAPRLSVHWSDDTIHGTVKTWYDNGQLQSQREYAQNQKNGTAIAWYKDGSIMLVEEYDENKLISGQYYKRGSNEPISTVHKGSGIATLHDEQGIYLKKVVYIKGELVDNEE
jgi:antitoxin component YwqK of YwqJK toxin-antitoxin module